MMLKNVSYLKKQSKGLSKIRLSEPVENEILTGKKVKRVTSIV
jgi:hypothetical protein